MDPYGYGMQGGGMGSQSTMMISSVMMICLSVVAAVGIFFLMNNQSDVTKDIPDDVTADDVTPAPVTDDLTGLKLLTLGGLSLKVEGSSCGNGVVKMGEKDNDKWVWRIQKISTWPSAGKEVPVYTIESFYRQFSQSCEKRFLEAPVGCKGAPFLANRKIGPSQAWIFVSDGSTVQLRSLQCAQSRHAQSFLVASAGEKSSVPFFSGGSGSPFTIQKEDAYGSV